LYGDIATKSATSLDLYSKVCPGFTRYDFIYEEKIWISKTRYPPINGSVVGYHEKNLQIFLEYIAINYAQKEIEVGFVAGHFGLTKM
jgi:hypothetical protein